MTEPQPKHARIGPSSLSRVSICPGSVREAEGLPRRSSVHSARGTLLHEIVADCLELGLEPHVYAGRTMSVDGHTFTFEDEELDKLLPGLDWIRQQPGRLWIETRVPLDPWLPGQFGTLDIGMYDPEDNVASVFDWKMGEGVAVAVKGNKQLRAYGFGLFETVLKAEGIIPAKWKFYIEQPYCRDATRFSDPWEQTHEELMEFAATMPALYERVQDPNAPLVASEEGCRFCDVKNRPGGCDAHTQWLLDAMSSKFDDLDDAVELGAPFPPSTTANLTPERRTVLIKAAPAIRAWLAKLHDQALRDAAAGLPVPRMKAVAGQRGDRYYTDPDKAAEILVPVLGEDAFTKKLISPAKAEKVAAPTKRKRGHPEAWAELQKLIGQDEGKPILVDENDERPALKTIDQKFDDAFGSDGDE